MELKVNKVILAKKEAKVQLGLLVHLVLLEMLVHEEKEAEKEHQVHQD